VRNAVKSLKENNDIAEVEKKMPVVISQVDKLAKKGVIHKNKAANLKSKMMRKANVMKAAAAPKTEN